MSESIGLTYPFTVRINLQKKNQLAYWSRKFSVSEKELDEIIQIAGPSVRDVYTYLQTLKPVYVRTMTYQQILAQYEAFVEYTVGGYLLDLPAPRHSTIKFWPVLLNEVAEEAGRLADVHGRNVDDKLKLVAGMKNIAEAWLLTVSLKGEA